MFMNRIKKTLMTLVIFVLFLSNVNTVKAAIYNGNAGTAYIGQNISDECINKQNCFINLNYNNRNNNDRNNNDRDNNGSDKILILQARLNYIKNGNFEPVGNTIYFVDSDANTILKSHAEDNMKNTIIKISAFDEFDTHEQASTYLKNRYFYRNNAITEKGKVFLRMVTGLDDYSELISEESTANGNIQGYRLVIEPAYIYANPSFGTEQNYALMTPKGIAAEIVSGKRVTCQNLSCQFSLHAKYLYNQNFDAGVQGVNERRCSNLAVYQLANIQVACGYHLINMKGYVSEKKCYSRRIDGNELKCINSDENNIGNYNEVYTEKNCTSADASSTNNKSGKQIAVSGTCKIYCTESATISLPGNISKPIQKGSYFAWPTLPNTNGLYSMSMKSTLNCTIKDTGASSGSVAATLTMDCAAGYTSINNFTCRSNTETAAKVCPYGYTELPSNTNSCYLSESINATSISDAVTYQEVAKVCPNGVNAKGKCKKYCNVGTLKEIDDSKKCVTCPSGYSIYSSNAKKCKSNTTTAKVCPSGYDSTGKSGDEACKKMECPSGYSETGGSGNYACSKYLKTTYETGMYGNVDGGGSSWCTSKGGQFVDPALCGGSTNNSSSCCKTVYYDYEPKSPVYSKKNTCPSGTVKESGKCYELKNSTITSALNTKTCPATTSFVSGGKCYQWITPYCNPGTGTLTIVNGQYKCVVCTAGYTPNAVGMCEKTTIVAKSCPSGYTEVYGTCYKTGAKNQPKYSCSEGYKISDDQKTCNKICDKESLINNAKSVISSNEQNAMSAKLTAGTNKKIDKTLQIYSDDITTKQNNENIIFNRVVKFKIPDNFNRYYNKITGEVSNEGTPSDTIYDRGEGVISLSQTDKIYNGTQLIDYSLKISNVNLGSGNQFGNLINEDNYSCTYNIAEDGSECVCPNGTRNAGMSIKKVTEKFCNCSNKTCSEWQYQLCDSKYDKIFEMQGCTDKFYCNNTQTNEKIDITECVKNKSNETTLEKAIEYCELNEKKCTNEYCYNQKSQSSVSIEDCLNNGNSREVCYRKMGCFTGLCESEKYCTGDCSWNYEKINDSISYGLETCNGNYCGFVAYCTDSNKKTSVHTNKCIQNKLNTSNITTSLNNGLNKSVLERAIKSCESTICASSEKIVYRVIDLNNPFPGKEIKGTNANLSLTSTKNRSPGYNWNSETAVKNEILNARGTEGYKLYNKEPLITITLTPSDIKAIQKYNDSNSYNDFKMTCVKDKSAGCISDFLHKKVLDTTLKIDGINSCTSLNASSTIEEYNKCYNDNN